MSNESVQLIYPSDEMVKNAAVSGWTPTGRCARKRMPTTKVSGPSVPVK
jgi:hypothetical protein